MNIVLRRGWWIGASVGMAVVIVLAVGLGPLRAIVFAGLAGLNSAGVKIYCDQIGDRFLARQRVMQVLAVALVPVGLLAVIFTRGGGAPSDHMFDNDDVGGHERRAGVYSNALGPGGRSGMG